MRKQLGWDKPQFEEKYRKIQCVVDRRYRNGREDEVFKGKWYQSILEMDLRDAGLLKNAKGSLRANA